MLLLGARRKHTCSNYLLLIYCKKTSDHLILLKMTSKEILRDIITKIIIILQSILFFFPLNLLTSAVSPVVILSLDHDHNVMSPDGGH